MAKVAVIVGSLRTGSINRKLAEGLGKLAADRLDFHFVEIGDLPIYNEDLWEIPPASVLRMKREVKAADAVLFVTPEYNRSFTPAIKNVVDWGTRPYGENAWEAKPSGLIGTSPGAIGTAAAQNSLRGLLNVVDTVLMGQPEIYLKYSVDYFDAQNNIIHEPTAAFLNSWIDRFKLWIERTSEPKTTAQADI